MSRENREGSVGDLAIETAVGLDAHGQGLEAYCRDKIETLGRSCDRPCCSVEAEEHDSHHVHRWGREVSGWGGDRLWLRTAGRGGSPGH